MHQPFKKMYRQSDCIPLVCIPPHDQLLNAVKSNNTDLIKRLVDNDSDLLIYPYEQYQQKTILEAACSDLTDLVKSETIQLLTIGADLEQPNEHFDKMRVIHFAAEMLNFETLKVIVQEMEKKNINFNLITSHGNTALMHMIKYADSKNESFLNCVTLLAKKVEVNCIDNDGIPVVFTAAKKDLTDVVNILKAYELDVDSYKDRRSKKTARNLIEEKNWFSSNDFPEYKYSDNEPLAQKIISNELTTNDLVNLQDVNKKYHAGTLLQILVQRSYADLVKKLLEYPELDCNKTTSRNKDLPIKIALERGDYEILSILLGQQKCKIPDDLLCQVLCNFDRIAPSLPGRDYKRCAYVCLEDRRVQNLLNKPGDKGNYPLHYACRYTDESTILALLEKKTSLANRSNNDYLAMSDIHRRTLEAHLDSCLAIHESEPKSHNEEKEIRFNFTTLLPTTWTNSDTKTISIDSHPNGCFGYHDENKKLLINGNARIEMDVPIFMSQSVELKPLLTHPILAMFINLKWEQVSRIYYLNLSFYIALCIFLYTYIFLFYINEDWHKYSAGIKILSFIIYIINIACLAALVLREVFQFWLEKLRYMKNIENYIELTLIFAMLVMVLRIFNDYSAKKQVASIAILFSAMELFLLIGKKPVLSTNIVILRTVSLTFFKLLLWYSILIFAFALSFYTLFSGQKQEEGDDPNFFTNPALAAIKTIVMLTGEFDAGSIKFDSIPIISHMIFLMFVFMISMVLFNLMNGLAVTDTQIIKNESELYSYVSQIQYIAYIEGMLTNHQLSTYLKKLCKDSFFASDGPHIMYVPLHKGRRSYGYFNEPERLAVRQNIVKRAKLIIEERRAEKEENIARKKEKVKMEQMEKTIQEMLEKINSLIRNETES